MWTIVSLFLWMGAQPAEAYETDQLTRRQLPLRDAAPVADAEMDEVLRLAVLHINAQTQCKVSESKMVRVLAKEIMDLTARPTPVPERGGLKSVGFGSYAAFLESSHEIERRDFHVRDDIYSDTTPWHSVILSTLGPSSTLNLAGTSLGTDKIDHFLSFGYRGYRHSRWGAKPERGVRWSVNTERRFFGLLTSKTFSFGDLAANADGYSFYVTLLSEDSILTRQENGCVAQNRPWHWSDWVDWQYDEVLNPAVHTKVVQRRVDARIEGDLELYCLAYASLSTDYDEHIAALLAQPRQQRHPQRTDPFRLGERCVEADVPR